MNPMRRLHQHWMLIPLGVAIALVIATVILAATLSWPRTTVGGIVTVILAITAAVGSMLAPREP